MTGLERRARSDDSRPSALRRGVCDSSASVCPKQVAYWSSPTLSATSAFESSARGKPLRRSGDSMNQEVNPEEDEDMLPEYDFAHGVRGKHQQGRNQRDFS